MSKTVSKPAGTANPKAADAGSAAKGKKFASDIKGFKKSKIGNYVSIGSQVFGVLGIYKQARRARDEQDTLKLVDAAVSAAAVATGLALIIREMRRAKRGDVLADQSR